MLYEVVLIDGPCLLLYILICSLMAKEKTIPKLLWSPVFNKGVRIYNISYSSNISWIYSSCHQNTFEEANCMVSDILIQK